ncbi:hypothetical protein LTS02_015636 [Friedmanniomyces endolithicus]|nr:hypothetical protein LTR75_016945 [Friedmanniomyces endolithicus]KAK0844580.1 hypothetical protein LTS02_015636 [Friedmanniomyces endolithicus]
MPIVCYGLRGEVIPPLEEKKTFTYRNFETTFTNTVTTKSGRKITVPRSLEAEDQTNVADNLKRETEAIIPSQAVPRFAAGNKQAHHRRICWDALTHTEDRLTYRHSHPKLSNLYVALGGIFHGYKQIFSSPPSAAFAVMHKFLPNAGKYMVNVLTGASNGAEKDQAWSWKRGAGNAVERKGKREPAMARAEEFR